MSGTMHIENMFARQANLYIGTKTKVKYTQASGLPDWEGRIEGILASSSIPNKQDIETVDIGKSVTSIGNGAFYGCSGLTSVTIPDSVTNIGDGAFLGCSGLTSVTIPNGVTSIGPRVFYTCYGLTNITIPNNITRIENGTFYYCNQLSNITILGDITYIGQGAFLDCPCTLYNFSNNTSVPDLFDNNVFNIGYNYSPSPNLLIVVPDNLYDSWVAASNWSDQKFVGHIISASNYANQ